MKLKILAVYGHGDASEEHVILRVLQDTQLNRYIVADSTFTAENTVSNTFRHVKWLPSVAAKTGEYVALWTKKGKYQKLTHNDGNVWHHVYWGSNSAVWNDTGDAAILFELATWKFTRARG